MCIRDSGYTYSTQERKVLDWSGFAGCWFAPALVYLYRMTGEERCLHSAAKALDLSLIHI